MPWLRLDANESASTFNPMPSTRCEVVQTTPYALGKGTHGWHLVLSCLDGNDIAPNTGKINPGSDLISAAGSTIPPPMIVLRLVAVGNDKKNRNGGLAGRREWIIRVDNVIRTGRDW